MSALERHVDDYLRLRRTLGYDLEETGRLLHRFAVELDAAGVTHVTTPVAVRWALAPRVSAPSSVPATRYRAVRGFARYMAGIDPETEIPPAGLVRRPRSRRSPFIYTDEDVLALLEQARATIAQPLRAATMHTLIGLLAASGLRIGEALRLDRGDIDWVEGVLRIRQSKFNKSRLVPPSTSVLEELERYARLRDRLRPAPVGESFFVSLRGTRVIHACVWKTFRALCDGAGVGAGSSVRPTIHDLRHRFAVRVLVGWYQQEVDVQPRLAWLSTYLGHRDPVSSYWYLSAAPELLAHAARLFDTPDGDAMTLIAPTIQAFFSDRLAGQLQASPRTIASYRDTLRLLLHYTHQQTGKPPSALDWDDLDEELISGFLEHLETVRGNVARTRNLRLTAIRSLFTFASLRHPEHAHTIARVLAIPPKRHQQRTISYLSAAEAVALINAPDPARWEGRRDRTLLTLAIHTGLRVSELTGLDCGDVTLGTGANVRCRHSKGRKQRAVPLIAPVRPVLAAWLAERAGRPEDPLFPTRAGRRLSTDAIAQRVSTHTATAATTCASLNGKHLHPHALRHSCAMSLLQAGVDTAVISLWLGHADVRSTDPYIHADLTIKEKALALVTPPDVKPGRYKPPDQLLAFLEDL